MRWCAISRVISGGGRIHIVEESEFLWLPRKAAAAALAISASVEKSTPFFWSATTRAWCVQLPAAPPCPQFIIFETTSAPSAGVRR
jgi:hypothetical protein